MGVLDFNPIDLIEEIVRAQAGRWRPGDKIPLVTQAKMREGRARVLKLRQREATKRVWRELAPSRLKRTKRGVFGYRIVDRIAAVMEPGGWYGRMDLIRAIGDPKSSRSKVYVMWRGGLIERAANPDYDPAPAVLPGAILPRYESVWLYRLTETGVALRERVLAVRNIGRGAKRTRGRL